MWCLARSEREFGVSGVLRRCIVIGSKGMVHVGSALVLRWVLGGRECFRSMLRYGLEGDGQRRRAAIRRVGVRCKRLRDRRPATYHGSISHSRTRRGQLG